MRQVARFLLITALLHTDFTQAAAAPIVITTAVATAPAAPVVATTAACAAFGWWCYHAMKAHRLSACHKYLRTVLSEQQYQAFCREQEKYLSPYGAANVNELSADEQESLIRTLTRPHEPVYTFSCTTTPLQIKPHLRTKRTELLKQHQQSSLTPETITAQPCMGIYEQRDITYHNPPRSHDKTTADSTTAQLPGKSYEDCRCPCHDLRVGIPAPLCVTCPWQHPHPYGLYRAKADHHPNSRGLKSPGPNNRLGQRLLDHSISMLPLTDRITIDYRTLRFVQFYSSGDGSWHGFYVDWKHLDRLYAKYFSTRGLTTATGRIIVP